MVTLILLSSKKPACQLHLESNIYPNGCIKYTNKAVLSGRKISVSLADP